MMNQPTPQIKSTPRKILWLAACLLVGFFLGNIIFGLPFAALLYWGVPETKFSRRWTWWMKRDPALRVVFLVVAMYVFMFLFLMVLGPWLTRGMRK